MCRPYRGRRDGRGAFHLVYTSVAMHDAARSYDAPECGGDDGGPGY